MKIINCLSKICFLIYIIIPIIIISNLITKSLLTLIIGITIIFGTINSIFIIYEKRIDFENDIKYIIESDNSLDIKFKQIVVVLNKYFKLY